MKQTFVTCGKLTVTTDEPAATQGVHDPLAFSRSIIVTVTFGTGAEVNIVYAIMLSWPIALTGIVAIAFRRRLRQPFAFICLGYLVCVGIFYLIGQTDTLGGWIHTAAATRTDKLLAVVINRLIECVAVAIPLSILPLVWLCKLMLWPSAVDNPDLQAET